MEALKYAKAQRQDKTLSICNVPESAIPRASRLVFLTRAGAEIGVASTKAFTTQLVALFALAVTLGKLRGQVGAAREGELLEALRHLPGSVQHALNLEPQVASWAEKFAPRQHALFLGRGTHYPIALEGALKLKEISYIHAEGYPAGELKHGPLALVDQTMPVIAVAPNDHLIDKLRSNMEEVRARGGQLYLFVDERVAEGMGDARMLVLPSAGEIAAPVVSTIPLQLLAYHVAVLRGTDVDQPRNLAKSVTVE